MIYIYDYTTGKVKEVILDRGEQEYLCRHNLRAIRAHNAELERAKEMCISYEEESSGS